MNTASLTGDFDGFPLSSAPQILTMGHCTSDLWILCSQFKNIPPFSLLFPHSPTPLPLSRFLGDSHSSLWIPYPDVATASTLCEFTCFHCVVSYLPLFVIFWSSKCLATRDRMYPLVYIYFLHNHCGFHYSLSNNWSYVLTISFLMVLFQYPFYTEIKLFGWVILCYCCYKIS